MSEPTGLRGTLRALPPAAWILFAGTFINRFGSFVLTFLVLYVIRQGFSVAQAGAAAGGYGLGSLCASAAGGYLADRLGRRSTIAISMFSAGATMLALSVAREFWAIIALAALAGLTAELYRPATGALLADLVPPAQRVTAFALYRLAINAGFALGPATAGFLADRSFFYVFVGDAVTSVIFGVIALTALPEGVRVRAGEERRGEILRAVATDPIFLRFLVASLLIAFVYFQSTSTFALHVRAAGLSNVMYGALVSLNGLIIVFLELPLTAVTQRLPPRPVIALGMLLIGVGYALTGVAFTVPALAATVLIWTLGEITGAPVASAYVANIAPRHLRGRYQGAWGLTWGAALILAPAVGTPLFAWSPIGLWITCGGLGVAASLLVLVGREPVRPPAG